MTRTVSALVKNRPGVLAEMAAAIRKYNVNIRSMSAGETDNPPEPCQTLPKTPCRTVS